MNKFSVLVLVALGAQVNGNDNVADAMVDRVFVEMVPAQGPVDTLEIDLDDSLLAKGKGGVVKPAPSKPARVANRQTGGGSNTPWSTKVVRTTSADGKRLFGGTNKLLAGIGKPATDYSGKTGFRAPKAVVKTKSAEGKPLFGGTNKLLAGIGKPATEKNAPPKYWGR